MVTPAGTVPPSVKVIGAVPPAVSLNVPPVPATKEYVFAEVIVGGVGAALTVRVKFCGAELPAALDAVIVKL